MPTSDEGPAKAPAVRHEVEGPRMADALYEPFKNEPTPIGVDPSDGLPRPIVSQAWKDAQAPALDPDRFVCMADCSSFVLRDEWGTPALRFEPSEVERAPNGRWRVKSATVAAKLKEQGGEEGSDAPSRLSVTLRARAADALDVKDPTDEQVCEYLFNGRLGYVAVEPLRPQCRHYARQLIPFPDDREHTMAIRLCTARRTDEGEFLDVGNQQVLACELREPVFGNEVARIDAFEAQTFEDQKKSKANEVADDFDLDAALGAQDTTTKGH